MSTKVTLAYNETVPVKCDQGHFHRDILSIEEVPDDDQA